MPSDGAGATWMQKMPDGLDCLNIPVKYITLASLLREIIDVFPASAKTVIIDTGFNNDEGKEWTRRM